ncbi:MAG: glycosyltransferase [Hydrococcus sp. Prado102]|jgi:GT2 family glycosyltransferase|nr:glycosyltransferase [Hydrococcus sp. Prado102]
MTDTVLSIVIGTRNRKELLQQCLKSLVGNIQVKHEIIVIDAGSTDGTIAYLESRSGIKLVKDGQLLGQARSLNQVFKTLNSTYICWLSDDNEALNGMLDVGVSILEENPDIGMVALKVRDVVGQFANAPYIGGIADRTDILNCNQGIIRSDLLRQVGYFDETLRDYGIDVDLTTKVLLAGYKVVYTKEVAIHHYRDRDCAPGAFNAEERLQRQEKGKALYEQKYERVFQLKLRDRIRRKFGRIIYNWIQLASGNKKWKFSWANFLTVQIKLEFNKPYIFGYHIRDWKNLCYCRYISWLDFWHNRQKPFYLVQQIRYLPQKNDYLIESVPPASQSAN